ncbi:hypothetical protein [Lysobacter sp. CA199]|uniref:hypothetical protein n=1 Tax=Lysobacter sp. CA199 TaxID=3455608 RepID=UPI003F8D88BF
MNYGDAFATAAYRRDAGRVQLRGLIKGGAGGTVAFVLPAGFRPATQHLYCAVCDLPGLTRVDVKPSGEVQIMLPSSGTIGFLSLDGIGYFTE